jgi:hypothetical protein
VLAKSSYLELKTERFFSLFQRFVNMLKDKDTPVTVHAVEGETIMVCTTSLLPIAAIAEF